LLEPTLLAEVPPDEKVISDEIFAPVVSLIPVASLDDGIAIANSTKYGLQAGVFTQDLDRAFHAVKHLKVGGVMVNDTSSFHDDAMPYGGVKASGYGLEGPRYAVEEMTDTRMIVLNLKPPLLPL